VCVNNPKATCCGRGAEYRCPWTDRTSSTTPSVADALTRRPGVLLRRPTRNGTAAASANYSYATEAAHELACVLHAARTSLRAASVCWHDTRHSPVTHAMRVSARRRGAEKYSAEWAVRHEGAHAANSQGWCCTRPPGTRATEADSRNGIEHSRRPAQRTLTNVPCNHL
jgi:hypothetical protein